MVPVRGPPSVLHCAVADRDALRAFESSKLNNLKLALMKRDQKITRQLALQSDYKRILVLSSNNGIVRLPQLLSQMVKSAICQ